MDSDTKAVTDRITRLEQTISELQSELSEVRSKLFWYNKFHGNIVGEYGENLFSRWASIARVFGNKGHDLRTADGRKFEVKTSSLKAWNKGKSGYWKWYRLFGKNGSKQFDELLLIGESNPLVSEKYKSAGTSEYREGNKLRYKDPDFPFVIFKVSYDKIKSIVSGQTRDDLYLAADPQAPLSNPARELYKDCQVTLAELDTIFGAQS